MREQTAKDALIKILTDLTVQNGDIIMLGIDMGCIPLPSYKFEVSRDGVFNHRQKLCKFLLQTLLEVIGPQGTILAPAYTYSCGKNNSVFDWHRTPSEVGYFTEFIRLNGNSMRSKHPIFSLTGIGRSAIEILNVSGRSAFGVQSPFGKFSEYGVKFLCLGIELRNSLTYIHHLEQLYGCPHRFNKAFTANVFDSKGNEISEEWYAYVGYEGLGMASDISSIQNALQDLHLLKQSIWAGQVNHLAEVGDVDKIGYRLLLENPYAFLNSKCSLQFVETFNHDESKETNLKVSNKI